MPKYHIRLRKCLERDASILCYGDVTVEADTMQQADAEALRLAEVGDARIVWEPEVYFEVSSGRLLEE